MVYMEYVMKKWIVMMLLLLVLPLSAGAVTELQSAIDELPAVDVLQNMDMDQQKAVYDQTQAAYDAYMALSEEERAQLPGAEETFEALFGYFNTLVMPVEEAQAEGDTGSQLLSTVLAVAIGIFLAQKLITKRKL